jgi:acetyl-CoA carboxylase biotin carboxyl carrier protein
MLFQQCRDTKRAVRLKRFRVNGFSRWMISWAALFLTDSPAAAPNAVFPAFPLDAVSPHLLASADEARPARHASPSRNSQPFLTVELQEIRKIVELMNEHGLTLFDLTKKDFHLKLEKGASADALRGLLANLPAAAPVAVSAAPAAAAAAGDPPAAAAEGEEITSPMVGTFYRKPAPDAPNFVEIGSTVSVGQTVCIIEAMKVMNEIKAEKAGTICACVAEDGTPVQFGDALFRIK